MIKTTGEFSGVNRGKHGCFWGKHRVKHLRLFGSIFAVKCTNRLSANQAVTTVKPVNYSLICYKNNSIWNILDCSLRSSEKLLKISKVSYVWKTYRKHFSGTLIFKRLFLYCSLRRS